MQKKQWFWRDVLLDNIVQASYYEQPDYEHTFYDIILLGNTRMERLGEFQLWRNNEHPKIFNGIHVHTAYLFHTIKSTLKEFDENPLQLIFF